MSLNKTQLDNLIDAIHEQNELAGVIVGLYSGQMCSVAYPGDKVALPYWDVAVIIEEVDAGGRSVIVPINPTDMQAPGLVTNRSRMWAEFRGAGLNCTFTVAAGVAVAGAAAAELPSGGTSTFILVASWTGLVTSGLQCVNGIVRSVAAVTNPDSDSLAQWDENSLYSVSFLIVDAIGVVAALITLRPAIKNLIAVLQRSGGLASTEALGAMGRAARAKAIRDALAQASRNGDSAKVLQQALKSAGITAGTVARVARSEVIAARNAKVIAEAISRETARRLIRAVIDVLASADSPIVSSMPATWVGSASGSVNKAIEVAKNATAPGSLTAQSGVILHVVGLDADADAD
jgi:hypothetical protein